MPALYRYTWRTYFMHVPKRTWSHRTCGRSNRAANQSAPAGRKRAFWQAQCGILYPLIPVRSLDAHRLAALEPDRSGLYPAANRRRPSRPDGTGVLRPSVVTPGESFGSAVEPTARRENALEILIRFPADAGASRLNCIFVGFGKGRVAMNSAQDFINADVKFNRVWPWYHINPSA